MSTHVDVTTMAGDCMDFDLDAPYALEAVHEHCQMQWKVPALCQRLFVDEQILTSGDLSMHCKPGKTLCIKMVVSLQDAIENIAGPSEEKRQLALRSLSFPQARGHEDAIAAANRHAFSRNDITRTAAWQALVALLPEGAVATRLYPYLQDRDSSMRCFAAEFFSRVAKVDDREAIGALSNCLADTNALVRCTAVRTLGLITSKANEYAIATVSEHLDCDDEYVRGAAVRALGQIAGDQNTCVLEALEKQLREDRSGHVKSVAREVLARMRHT